MATKKDKIQDLRRSQFILTYGPGSILEGRDGPRIIPSLGWGLGGKLGRMLQEYEVHDLRMSFVLRKMVEKYKDFNMRFFVLPSNSSERKVNLGLYRTYIFPAWRICYGKDGKHEPNIPILYDSSKYDYCPLCHQKSKTSIRFVCACPDGHLDDVDWKFAVHDNEKSCDVDYFYWNAGGSSLSSIKIKCPECGAETNMGDVYQKKYFKCTGRFPEKEAPLEDVGVCYSKRSTHSCNQRMRVVQRQSTSLRIANTLTLLKIPKYDKQISNVLQIGEVASLLDGLIAAEVDETVIIKALEGSHKIASETKEIIIRFIDDNNFEELIKLAKELYNEDIEVENILIEEFETLKGEEACSDNFCKGPPFLYDIKFGKLEFPFKVYPVDKITTVTAQIGYQRKPYMKKDKKTNKILESPIIPAGAPREDGSYWYPVYEGIGEGIFITSDENPIDYLNLNDNANEWIQKRPKRVDRWRDSEVKTPEFVWWHSLSHALIRALSYFSGYSSASIRERIYLGSEGRGGVFLYTTSAGEDCGMGGLVESSEKFKLIIEEALKSASLCSHDPLCSKIRISSDRVNGSACHYCLFVPETSCEHGNMWLDRHLLKGD